MRSTSARSDAAWLALARLKRGQSAHACAEARILTLRAFIDGIYMALPLEFRQMSLDLALLGGATSGAPGLDIDLSKCESPEGLLAAVERALIPIHTTDIAANRETTRIFRWVVLSAVINELFMFDLHEGPCRGLGSTNSTGSTQSGCGSRSGAPSEQR